MFPPIPENTIRAARASYGKGNVYLRLGDQINRLLSPLDSDLLAIHFRGYEGTMLAAVTIIQYVERLTDAELTEALHGRLDLRYALHLPNPGPRIDPLVLCTFRQHVLKDPPCRLLLEEVFRLVYPTLGANEPKAAVDALTVVKSICLHVIRASVVEAMFHAIEALSANHFTWLSRVASPHWYERYSPSLWMLDSSLSIKQKEPTTDDLRVDIQYLLRVADQSGSEKINEIPEIRVLRHRFDQLLHSQPEKQCAYCFQNSLERRTAFYSNNQNPSQA